MPKDPHAVCEKCGTYIALSREDKYHTCSSAPQKRKNPAAVALGRKGGKKTGRKGFAAMDPAKAQRIRKMAEPARKKYPEGGGIYGAEIRGGACGD